MTFQLWKCGLALVVAWGLPLLALPTLRADPALLFQDDFSAVPDGLLTNEYALHNPKDAKARLAANWEMTSGSLFAKDGAGATGVPDHATPDALSEKATNSAVFRCRTKADKFGDVDFSLAVWNEGFVELEKSPAKSYDGIHLWLRYIDDKWLYSVTINRRDHIAVIKKKVPGGPSNGGTYYTLKQVPFSFPLGAWQHFTASAKNNADGSVTIALSSEGKPVVSALDDGTQGGAAITAPGRVGVRGDNCQFKFDDVVVRAAS